MRDVIEIAPTEDESCCSCSTSNVRLHRWTDDDPFRTLQTHQHCDLCYETDFGSRCSMKHSGYGDAMDIMRHITQVAHIMARRPDPGERTQK
jgi:hypothetical protein